MNAKKPESKNIWRLHVENFGRIESADIDIVPMMMFVGPNSTGKSYLASLIWGLIELKTQMFPEKPEDNPCYSVCKELFIAHCRGKHEYLSVDLIEAMVHFYNAVLDAEKKSIVRKIFTFDGLKIGKLTVDVKDPAPIKPRMLSTIHNEDFFQNDDEIYRQICWVINHMLFNGLDVPLYLPASRTGFMLSYKSLTKGLMETWGIEKTTKSDFPLPIIRFLQKLIETDTRKGKAMEKIFGGKFPGLTIAQAMEKGILEGQIVQNGDPSPTFYYQPDVLASPLPLHATSSLVSELTPLIIFLKGYPSLDSPLIFEEPESHLHLKAQRILAKYLVKLVNHGMPIWLTTHSDTFFQQINNLITSNEYRKRKLTELGYSEDEMIAPDNIRAYQFNVQKESGMTEVVPLKRTEGGFAAPTFNYEILSLSEESMELESDEDDLD